MIKSMTGYGRGEAVLEGKKIVTEIKSFNHRFSDISVKLPKRFSPLETEVKKLVNNRTTRGKIDLTIQFENTLEDTFNLAVNLPLARTICELLDTLKKELNLSGDINLSTILSFKDIISPEREVCETQSDWEAVKHSCEEALNALQLMQDMEGTEIANDMRVRLDTITRLIDDIEVTFPQSLADRQRALQERVKKLCEGIELDQARIMQEIAFIADRTDITEELIRAKSHLKQFSHWLESQEPIGRKLDFLLQEINREVNTIGSKVSDAHISLNVVSIKNELEKIREQVQNVL
jgi:uncharacterized protein (TIGR00255 family)